MKDLQKENLDLLEADPGRSEEGVSRGLQKSLPLVPEVRTEILGLAAKGTQAPDFTKHEFMLEIMQNSYPKSKWTHVFTDGSAENAVRNRGSVVYIHRPDGTPSPSQLVT